MAKFRIRIKKDQVVRIHRILLGKGTIRVTVGQQVNPSDILGESFFSSGFRIIRLAEELSVPPQEVKKYLTKSLGQRIYKGELLAQNKGSFLGGKKNITAPSDGTLDLLNPQTGELKMTIMPKKQSMLAGVFGIVDFVDIKGGEVVIKTQADLLYGLFGSGKSRDGALRVFSRDALIGKSVITSKLDGQIIAGGSLVLKDAISAAISSQVSGFITGGINASDFKSMAGNRLLFPKKLDTDIGISIIVCEGFGSIPMGIDVYNLLKTYDGRFISIDGDRAVAILPSSESDSIDRVKKTHLPPIFTQETSLRVDLKIGLRARIIGSAFAGEQGLIVALDKTETKMLSGVKAIMATIETAKRKIQMPVDNLEVIDYIH